MRTIEFRPRTRLLSAALLGGVLPMLIAAQTPIQFGVFYNCTHEERFKIFSCAGNDPTSSCDVQAFNGAQPPRRGPAPRSQVTAMVKACHIETPAEAKAAASSQPAQGAAPQTSSNGIKVGDSVEVITGFGWSPAKVIAIQGNNYRVNVNGVQVTKTYPSEVRRVGPATPQDQAAGQYRLGDRVQVKVNGQWVEGKIITDNRTEYQVQFGNQTVWAGPQNLRPSTAPPPAAAAKASGPPKPGMTSCAGKIEGRYATTGQGSATIIFRSGKATMTNGFGGEDTLECWTSSDKIILREPGRPGTEMSIDINNDGTLEVPIYGEFKKKGN